MCTQGSKMKVNVHSNVLYTHNHNKLFKRSRDRDLFPNQSSHDLAKHLVETSAHVSSQLASISLL